LFTRNFTSVYVSNWKLKTAFIQIRRLGRHIKNGGYWGLFKIIVFNPPALGALFKMAAGAKFKFKVRLAKKSVRFRNFKFPAMAAIFKMVAGAKFKFKLRITTKV
jgi:hypothetical protein